MLTLQILNKPKTLQMKCRCNFPNILPGNFQEKNVVPSKEIQEITADKNYDALSKVIVDKIPDEYIIPTGTLDIVENGIHDIKAYENVNVNVGGVTIDDASYLFYRNARINDMNKLLPLIKNCIYCGDMFAYCTLITELDLSSLDMSKVTGINEMFYGCTKLEKLILSSSKTSNVTNMTSAFNACSKLTTLDVSNFDTSKVTVMSALFNNCSGLQELDLSNWNTPKLLYGSNMFSGCTNLTKIDMRNFYFSNMTANYMYSNMFNGVPSDCLIIVKDNTAKKWITSKFTNLTNVKTVDEL